MSRFHYYVSPWQYANIQQISVKPTKYTILENMMPDFKSNFILNS